MAGQATAMRVPTPGTFLGEFHIKRFDITRDDDRISYEKLRTQANKRNSDVTIEQIRDLVETETFTDAERNQTRTERWYIVVSWWDKTKEKEPEPPDDKQVFYIERGAGG